MIAVLGGASRGLGSCPALWAGSRGLTTAPWGQPVSGLCLGPMALACAMPMAGRTRTLPMLFAAGLGSQSGSEPEEALRARLIRKCACTCDEQKAWDGEETRPEMDVQCTGKKSSGI